MSPMMLVARIADRTMTTWSLYGSKKTRMRRSVRARRSFGIGTKSVPAPPRPIRPPPLVAPPVAVRVCPRGNPITRRYHGTRKADGPLAPV